MIYTADYDSPIGNILLAAEDGALCGLWFYGGKYFPALLGTAGEDKALSDARCWLDIYFTGREPDFMPLLRLSGSPVSNGGLGAAEADPLWGDRYLRRPCRAACRETRP